MDAVPRRAAADDHRRLLRADCERCAGLCCVAPAFARSADFALDKPAGVACPNLAADFSCGIHDRLAAQGFAGCVAYDCFGAGQQVTQVTFLGTSWRTHPAAARRMFAAFDVMRDLHELLWYLHEALALPRAAAVHEQLRAAIGDLRALTGMDDAGLAAVDRAGRRRHVNDLLLQASALVRGPTPRNRQLSRRDLSGRDFSGRDLAGSALFAARLLGADFTGADLRGADLRGADLRGADLSGADLSECLFVIQAQVQAARGDARTRLPDSVSRPRHWAHDGG